LGYADRKSEARYSGSEEKLGDSEGWNIDSVVAYYLETLKRTGLNCERGGLMVRTRRRAASVAVTVGLAVTGCGHMAADVEDSPPVEASRDRTQVGAWTAGIIDRPRPDSPTATLAAVRTGTHAGFDRVVFEFAERVPGYHTEYIDRPVRQCGSGKVAEMAGDGWLEVRMAPARAYTDAGRATVAARERMPGQRLLAELKLTCDFEGVLTWVLGLESPNRYRVYELSRPPRLVVDVRH
jgi:hypothetical protein